MNIQRRGGGKRWLYVLAALLLLGSYSYWALQRPLPLLKPALYSSQLPRTSPIGSSLAWPANGQAAVGLLGTDIIETKGAQTPSPTASTAKVITALVVLQEKPLARNQAGPIITLTDADVALYRNYAAQDGSLVPVTAGEQISQYQMLQAIMLPSANNIADSLAIWAFGSLKAYSSAANDYLAKRGLDHTHVGDDASGMSPTTTSTASDLVKLGKLAMRQPVLAEIVGQSTATGIPLTTSVKNVNSLLGTANIIGIKTGNTDQAGGVFMSASRITINSKPVTIVTAVVGAPNLFAALKNSLALVKSAQANFRPVTVVKAGVVVGQYKVPWGSSIPAVAAKDLTTTVWNGQVIQANVQLKQVAYNAKDAGKVVLPSSALTNEQSIPVKLKTQPPTPSSWWRLLHPLR